jgi:hypothetical protein|tara:strand:+ start:765 stop:1490 length:726 start_codon:yes stop_codon:yes gene_type:complete
MKLEDLKKLISETKAEESILLEKPTPEQLNETALSRVKDKIENQNIPFAMLTAFRGVDKEISAAGQAAQRAENNKNQDVLKTRIKAAGFPWVDMRRSGYKEGGAEGEVVEEYSLLVYEEPRGDVPPSGKSLFDTARILASDYEQDSFLYGGPDVNNPEEYSIRLYTNDGEPIKDVWAGGDQGYNELGVVEDAEAEYWSMIDNKKTQFKEVYNKWSAFKPKSRLEAMKKQYYLKLAESKIRD